MKPEWNSEKSVSFIRNLNEEYVDVRDGKLDALNLDVVDQKTIEDLIYECNSIILQFVCLIHQNKMIILRKLE